MKLNNLITISPGFHRSVNIKYDLNRSEKVSGFIPTEKSEEIIEHIVSALQGKNNDCASMLIGSYGTGKSHIMTFLGSLMSKKVDSSNFQTVLQKIKNERTKSLLEKELEIKSPYLVVPILGNNSIDFEQQLLFSLKTVLTNKKIKLNINSSFTSALKFIEMWKNNFPEVYSNLEELLKNRNYGTINKLQNNLKKFNSFALDVFIDIYPELSAGAEFDSIAGDAVEVYRDVATELIRKGYRGIFIIFDEFNRVLDTSMKNSRTLKTLQDIAELACRSNDDFRLNILLASHRTIGQYLDETNDTLTTNEWRKIEGRFKLFDVSNRPRETYDLISRVIQKKDPNAYEIIANKNPQIKKISQHRRLKDLFDEMPFEEVQNIIVKSCIPLHPVTVFLLPRISAKLAQNERTLFTFLADKKESPMTYFLDQDIKKINLIRPWHIFDYFEQQLRWSKDDKIKSVYIKVINAINSLPNNAYDEQKFLKTVGIYKIAGNKANLPCTLEMVQYGMGEDSFIKALTSLQQNKLIYVRQATNEIEIIEPSNIDLEHHIESWINNKSLRISPLTYLTKLGFKDYILPHRYNHIHKITRFLTPAYVDVLNAKTIIHKGRLTTKYSSCDGVICYLIPENNNEKIKLQQLAQNCHDERIIFAIPKKSIKISNSIMRLLALMDIKKKLRKTHLDRNAKTLINLYIEDINQDIRNKLKQVTFISSKVNYYWKSTRLNVKNKYDLSLYVSEMMSKVYKYCPIINNELINKDKPTTISKRARNKIIDLMLKNTHNIRDHLKTAQESFMFDTLFIATGIFNEKQNSFNLDAKGFEKVFCEIINYFKKSKNEFRDFTKLINILLAPPYGLRKGVIPVLLTPCIIKYSNYITIRNSSNLDCFIHSRLLDNIVKNPDKYYIKLDNWNENTETLVKGISEIFQVSLPTNIFSGNAYSEIGDAIFRWIASLPRYTRETKSISNSSQVFRRFAKIINNNPKHILIDKLPKALGFDEISESNVNKFLLVIKECKNELDNSLNKLLTQIKEVLYSWLLNYGNKDESLISLARNMLDQNSLSSISNSKVTKFIKEYNSYDEDMFAYGFSKIVMKIRPEDWLDDTLEEFKTALKQLEFQEKNLSPSSLKESCVKLKFYDSSDNHREISIYETDISDLGRLLQSHIESAIENFGDAVSQIEKRQILINIIKKLI